MNITWTTKRKTIFVQNEDGRTMPVVHRSLIIHGNWHNTTTFKINRYRRHGEVKYSIKRLLPPRNMMSMTIWEREHEQKIQRWTREEALDAAHLLVWMARMRIDPVAWYELENC